MRLHRMGLAAFAAMVVAETMAAKVDGTFIQPLTSDQKYSDVLKWLGQKPAAEGGVLTFANQTSGCKKILTLDKAGVTLGGIDFGAAAFSVGGEALTLTGDGVLRSTDGNGPQVNVGVTIADGATMTKRGKGKLSFKKLGGAGKLVIAEGTVVSQDGENFLCGCDLEIRTGHMSWYMPETSGDVDLTSGNLTFGPDRAQVVVTKGDVTSYKATFASLNRSPSGGFLELRLGNDISALGESEKILVKDRASDGAYVDASVVSRGQGNIGDTLRFLRYDVEKGFVPAETAPFVEGQSADGKVAVISEDTTVSANTSVSALQIENGAQLTVASGVTLTVGDGVHPAGVIWSGMNLRVRNNDANAYYWKGPGKLQFAEGADGIIYYNGSMAKGSSSWTGAPCVYLDGLVIAGNRGVTFAGVGNDNRDYGTFSIRTQPVVAWTGGTHVLGIRLQVNNQNALRNLSSPVYVLGDMGHNCGAQIRHNYTDTLSQDFYLGGQGVGWGTSHCGVFNFGGSPIQSFSGRVTLLNDTYFSCDNKAGGADGNGNLVFKGGLTGPGGFVYYELNVHSRIDLAGPADFAGGVTSPVGASQGLYVTGPTAGTGLGLVTTRDAATPVGFRRLNGTVASNDFAVAGTMDFTACTNVTFIGSVTSGAAKLNDGVTVACGRKGVAFGQMAVDGPAKITAGEDGGLVRLGAANDLDCAMTEFADGPNGERLAIEVDTEHAVTLYKANNSGAIRVRSGTLRLSDDVFARMPCTVRLDAGDDSSILTDENGDVAKCTSIADVPALAFVRDASYAAPTRTEELNGRKVLTFTRSDEAISKSPRLLGNFTNVLRTAIFVVRPQGNAANAGLFGVYDKDYGLRMSAPTHWNVYFRADGTIEQYGAFSSKALYVNGVQTWGSCTDGAWQIVSAIHGEEPTSCPTVFRPALGAYVTYEPKRAFNGDLAEVVLFPGILDDEERQTWENALAEKWGLPTPHPGFEPAKGVVLGGQPPLAVDGGATFDLNGVDATVASLSGAGTVKNSSDRPVKLIVTGANTFAGKVLGKVTIVNRTASTAVCALSDEAALVADGVKVTLGAANGGIVTDGLVYWLDAMKPETVLTNESGAVTSWVSRAGTVARFHNPGEVAHGDSKAWSAPQRYDLDGTQGRPGVYFGRPVENPSSPGGSNALEAVSAATKRTVILVGQMDGGAVSQSAIWQSGTAEAGFYITSGGSSWGNSTWRTYTGTTYHRYGYLQHVLGIDTKTGAEVFYDHTFMTSDGGDFPGPAAFIMVSELDDNANNFSSYKDKVDVLGVGYHTGSVGWLSEVLAYDRCLTEEEVRTMEEYLMNKWMRGTPPDPYVEERPVLAAGSGLAVTGGGSVDCGGAALTLSTFGGNDGTVSNYASLEVTDRFVFDVVGGQVKKLTVDGDLVIGSQAVAMFLNSDTLDRSKSIQPALEVTGEVSGGSLTTAEGLSRKWTWSRLGDRLWAICKNGFLLFVR